MACSIKKNKEGSVIGGIAPNGQPSILFKALEKASGSPEAAYNVYAYLRGEEFKKEFGIDWENDPTAIDKMVTDENGEPKLIAGEGHYLVIGVRGEQIPLPKVKNDRGFKPVYEVEVDIIDTVVSWVNDMRTDYPELFDKDNAVDTVKMLFDSSKTSAKGVLAEWTIVRAFTGIENVDSSIAEELYEILRKEGFQAMQDAMPEGVGLAEVTLASGKKMPVYEYFLNVYNEWDDIVNPITGNVVANGWKTKVKDALIAHGVKLTSEGVEEFTDDFVRVHDLSRLEEDPRKKMSEVVKGFLMDIRKDTNLFGYKTAYPLEHIYSLILESTVGQTSYNGMKNELKHRAKYKPELSKVLERLETLTAQQEAAFFSNFKLSYKSFLQFRSDKKVTEGPNGSITTVETRMFNSNESDTARRYRTFFKRQSKDYLGNNDRALYQATVDEKGNDILRVTAEKKATIEAAWNRISKGRLSDSATLPADKIDALGEMIWEMGMQYGPTMEATQDALHKYFEIGDGAGVKGKELFAKFVFSATGGKTNKNFLHLKNDILADKDIYKERGSIIHVIASITPLFDAKSFGSFISGTGKQYYPVNDSSTADEFITAVKSEELAQVVEDMYKDPLNAPGDRNDNVSILLRAFGNTTVREMFDIEVMDSFKAQNEGIATSDYSNQSKKTSFIVRLNAFANNGKKQFCKIALPTQADRSRLDFVTMPRIEALKELGIQMDVRKILRGIVVQDLSRISEASKAVDEARITGDTSKLIANFHYRAGSDTKFGKDGGAFTMTQVNGLKNVETGLGVNGKETLSDSMDMYLATDFFEKGIFTSDGALVNTLIEEQVDAFETMLAQYEEDVKARIKEYDINLTQDVDSKMSINTNFLKSFVLNDVIGSIELAKVLRGGYSFTKSKEDYYKRAGLLNTPGKKLAIEGFTDKNKEYGMMDKYGAITIKASNFANQEVADKVADTMRDNLIAAGVKHSEAVDLSDPYRAVDKADAQGLISLKMYRGIMMGIGEWDTNLDGQAYRNEEAGKGYVTDEGVARPIYPVKPYHEELKVVGKVRGPVMDKTSYMTVTSEMAALTPELGIVHARLSRGDVQVVYDEGATKGVRVEVQDLAEIETLDAAVVTVLDSTKLRLPQIMPKKSAKKITFSRQIRKNIISNMNLMGSYEGPWGKHEGFKLRDMFHELIAINLKEDTEALEGEMGMTALRAAKIGTEAYSEAKLEHLKKVRKMLIEQIKDKDLPHNYVKALDIVPSGKYDYKFEIPLSFPNYQAKFEQIFFSQFKSRVFDQKIKGKELVQIAELGGHEIDGDLKMYDGTSPAEVRIKASALGLPAGTDISTVDPALLRSIGYRIPNQGKNSMLPIQVIGFLPESHEKAIMVPGGITKQMGSDFDVDKMYLIQAETFMEGDVLTRLRPDYSKPAADLTKAERNTVLYDIMESVMTSPHHLEEVVKSLDSPILKNLANEIQNVKQTDSSIDYNHPLTEIEMEHRNKTGVAGRGLWANQLAGRNAAQMGELTLDGAYNPRIMHNGVLTEFTELAVDRAFVPGEGFTGNYTDYIISMYLSAAVDAANDPIQIDINDNVYTIPVAGMMASLGVPIEDVTYFLAQPIILEAIEYAELNDLNLGQLTRAIDAVAAEHKININVRRDSTFVMSSEELRDVSGDNKQHQGEYLQNFKSFFLAGRNLQTINKIITPDGLQNVNEISAINAHIEVEERYLRKTTKPIIHGTEQFNRGALDSLPEVSPITTAYRGLLDSMLQAADDVGFINNTVAFKGFKDVFKKLTNKYNLSAEHHKFIDRALFMKVMLSEGSPFAAGVSDRAIEHLYTNPVRNIANTLLDIQRKYPLLRNATILGALESGAENNSSEKQKVFTIKFDSSFDFSSAEKNAMSESLMQMLSKPERFIERTDDKKAFQASRVEIRNFAKGIIYNQLLTTGFKPGGYADMIPSEVFTTKILFDDKSLPTPVEYFSNAVKGLEKYDDKMLSFMHDFVANFGVASPGGVPLLPKVAAKKLQKVKSTIKSSAAAVYTPQFKTYTGNVTSLTSNQVFVAGTNPEGRHGAGSAKAANKFGLEMHTQMSDKAMGIMTKDLGPSYFKGNSPFKLETDLEGNKYYYSNGYNFFKDKVVDMTTGETFKKDTKSNLFKGDWNMKMPAEVIQEEIRNLYELANKSPNKEFLVADYSGSNLNGYSETEMAKLFKDAGDIPSNLVFNSKFEKVLSNVNKPTNAGASGGTVTVTNAKKSSIYSEDMEYAQYFVSFPKNGDPIVYVHLHDNTYTELNRQGAHPVHEIGVMQDASIFNTSGSVHKPTANSPIVSTETVNTNPEGPLSDTENVCVIKP